MNNHDKMEIFKILLPASRFLVYIFTITVNIYEK